MNKEKSDNFKVGFVYDTLAAGQPRAYADSVYHYRITFGQIPYVSETSVRLAAMMIRGYGRLDAVALSREEAGFCQPYFSMVEKSDDEKTWEVKIIEPFTD